MCTLDPKYFLRGIAEQQINSELEVNESVAQLGLIDASNSDHIYQRAPSLICEH
jgi:hypothetical protein